jgi:hypothetical protein
VKRSALRVGAVVRVLTDRGRPPRLARVLQIEEIQGPRGHQHTSVCVRLLSGASLRVSAVRIHPAGGAIP